MDKIKIFLATAKKHQFWVCCGVMLLTSLGCWWWACGNLSDLFKKRSSEIDGAFTSATVQPGAPNQGVIDSITKIDPTTQQDSGKLGRLKQKVFLAWESLYARQKKEDFFPKFLDDDFKRRSRSFSYPRVNSIPSFSTSIRTTSKRVFLLFKTS